MIIVAFALSPNSIRDAKMDVMPGEYQGILIFPSGIVDVRVHESDEKSFSIYCFTLEDSLKLLQDSPLSALRPLLVRENVTEFLEVVTFITSGTYAIMVTPTGNETISMDYSIRASVPPIGLTLIGVGLILSGVGIELIQRILVRRSVKSNIYLDSDRV